jgi:hypothetical protein
VGIQHSDVDCEAASSLVSSLLQNPMGKCVISSDCKMQFRIEHLIARDICLGSILPVEESGP